MKEKLYDVRSIALCLFWITLLFSALLSKSQIIPLTQSRQIGDFAEHLWQNGKDHWEKSLITTLSIDELGLNTFLQDNQETYFRDRGEFFNGILEGLISDDNSDEFFIALQKKYVNLYFEQHNTPLQRNADNPIPTPLAACNPSCYNINFQDGSLKGWNAFYAVNTSTTAATSYSTKTGGLCGSVTQAAGPNPNTGNSYHVQLMPSTGNDPIAGGLIPYKPPMGGTAAMIGDGSNITFGVGILEQTYLADTSAPILTLQYAVLLENPAGHPGDEQPWFKVEVLDQNGSPIPGCGQYFVVSGPTLPGFKAITYGSSTVYCRGWTTVFVPLYNYIGQCITVRFTASDCALGGHFGYAYVAATCEKLELIPSSSVFCTGQQSATIKGPNGDPATTYQWITTNGCISGSAATQSVIVTCPGLYTLVMSSGGNCVDTFSMELPSVPYGPPPVTCFSANRVCSGKPTQFDASCTLPNTGNTYYWDFYNSGNYDDSSGATPTWIFTSGGIYPVRLHVVTSNGCAADTIINVTVDSTYTYNRPSVTFTNTNVSACGQCNATVTVTLKSTSTLTDLTTSWNTCHLHPNNSMTGTCGLNGSFSISTVTSGGVTTYTLTRTFTGLCAGINYLYFNPGISVPPSPCNNGGILYDTIPIVIGNPNGINITANITSNASSCGKNNGSATLTGLGGTPGYAYSWVTPNLGNGNSKTGLSPGNYTVQITDTNGCVGIAKVTIADFSQLNAQIVPFDISCYGANNGSVKITPSAGVAPFTYLWTPAVSVTDSAGALAPGTYSVLITDAVGCTGTVSTTLKQPTQVVASIISAVISVNCNQTGSATTGVTGGYGPYTYKWTNGATTPAVSNLAIGTHILTVTDALGCQDTVKVTVSCGTPPKAIFISSDTTFCNESGACIDFFDQSTGNPTSWQWTFPGALPDTSTDQNPTNICYYIPGSYTVKLVISNGSGTDTMTVSPLIIFITGAIKPTITISHDTLFCSHATSYQWYYNGLPIPLATDSFYVPTLNGLYTVYITDINECNIVADPVVWSDIRGITDQTQITIYPNPAKDELWIVSNGLWNSRSATVELYNVLGENLYRNDLINQKSPLKTSIDISTFSRGVYFIRIQTLQGSFRFRFMKE